MSDLPLGDLWLTKGLILLKFHSTATLLSSYWITDIKQNLRHSAYTTSSQLRSQSLMSLEKRIYQCAQPLQRIPVLRQSSICWFVIDLLYWKLFSPVIASVLLRLKKPWRAVILTFSAPPFAHIILGVPLICKTESTKYWAMTDGHH